MGKRNGKADGNVDLRNADLRNADLRNVGLSQEDLEHELPAAEGGEEAASAAVGAKPAEVGAVSETEQLKAERDALLDRLARLQAEFDNARKRAVREQQEFREFAAADVIRNFLPILDSFERALKAGSGDFISSSNDFRNGVELIYRQFQDALQKIGVQPIPAIGAGLRSAGSRSRRNGRYH